MGRACQVAVLGIALGGCTAEAAHPFALTVTAAGSGLADVAVFVDDLQIADGTTSTPLVREFESHADALAALPFAMVLYHRGVTQDAVTVSPGVVCDGRVDVPVREELAFTVALAMGVLRLQESRYVCADASGEEWEMNF